MSEKIPENLTINEDRNKLLYEERRSFIIENYPISESSYDIDDLVSSGLDGKEVLEKRDDSGEDLEAILTYVINEDENHDLYCSLGIMLTREDLKGEGLMKELVDEIKKISREKKCEYIAAIPDTQDGDGILSSLDFYTETDSVNRRDYLRFDLD